jgi:osmotically-inducible protein OsmY
MVGLSAMITPGAVLARGQDHMTAPRESQSNTEQGVSSLERELAGEEFTTQAERDLVERVWARLDNDPQLSEAAQDLRITADANNVTLRGTVGSMDEKRNIGAKVQGIRGVREVHNRLRVQTSDGASADDTMRSSDRASADDTLRSSRSSYRSRGTAYVPPEEKHSRWWPRDRQVGTGGSRIGDEQLPGSGQMAETDYTGTTGPSGTRSFATTGSAVNALTRVAKPAGDYAFTTVDRNLAARIRQTLNGDPSLPVSNDNVHLKVVSGTVTLEGWVPSAQAKAEIGNKVAEISGVRGLNNQLQVARARTSVTPRD